MSNHDLWIVYENGNHEAEVFSSYEKALKYYEGLKEEAVDYGPEGIDPSDTFYLARVDKYATWIEDKEQPVYKTDELGDDTEEESGEYYWVLEENESGETDV